MGKKLFRSFCLLLTLLSPLPAHAGTTQLPQTNQTTCWNEAGQVITCSGTGQDGDKKIGASLPVLRFVINGDGTVTDTLNGLVWMKNANCFLTMKTWADALTSANALASGDCNLSDGSTLGQWRLPNVNEMETLINKEELNSATWLESQGFTDVQDGYYGNYWSSSTDASDPNLAWYVEMGYGYVDFTTKAGKCYVWPVRDRQ